MNRSVLRLAGAGFLTVLAMGVPVGCSTAGANFDTNNVRRIVKGSTTKEDVRRYFGDPLRTEDGAFGEVWTYTYVDTHLTGAGVLEHVAVGVDQSETTLNMLTVIFDGEVVRNFHFSNNSHTDTYLPWRGR